MRVLIVEDNHTGHRLVYVRYLVRHGASNGCDVVVALTMPGRASPEFADTFRDVDPDVEIIEFEGVANLDTVSTLARDSGATHVIVPDGDRLAQRLAVSRGWTVPSTLALLVMRDPIVEFAPNRRRRAFLAFKAALLRRADDMHGVRVVRLRSALADSTSDVPVALDPVEVSADDEQARAITADWGLDDDRFWFSVIGALGRRKNVPMVLEALCRMPSNGRRIGVLIAGRMEDDVRAEVAPLLRRVAEHDISCVVIDRLLEDPEVDAALLASDCLVAAHSLESPSGLVAKAALAGVRVVAAGAQALRRDVEALPVASWSPLEADALARAMTAMTDTPRPTKRLDLSPTQFCEALYP